MRPLLLQITVWEVKEARNKWEDRARLGGLGTNWKSVFYAKLTTGTPSSQRDYISSSKRV